MCGVSDAQPGANEHWCVQGQQGGDRPSEKTLELVQQQAHTLTYGTIFSGRLLPAGTSQRTIFSQKIACGYPDEIR